MNGFLSNLIKDWDWEIFWSALSSVSTFAATGVALFLGLRKRKPKIEIVIYERNFPNADNNEKMLYVIEFRNISTFDTGIRFIDLSKDKNRKEILYKTENLYADYNKVEMNEKQVYMVSKDENVFKNIDWLYVAYNIADFQKPEVKKVKVINLAKERLKESKS